MSLKQLGFSLGQIKEMIDNPNLNPDEIIKVQLDSVKEYIRIQNQLCSRLEKIYELLNSQQEVSADQFINLIEVINMSKEKYFTQEQQDKMFKQMGIEERKKCVSEWAEISAKIRMEYEKGTPPEKLEVTQLAKQWNELLNKLTFKDPEISKAAERYYIENPDVGVKLGIEIDKQLSDYIKNAMSQS
jgi:DNA-binding transcriptional MerR regulator